MLTQGLALQSTLQPLAGKTGTANGAAGADGGAEGGGGLDAMLQELNLPAEMGAPQGAQQPPAGGALGGILQKLEQIEQLQMVQQMLEAQEAQEAQESQDTQGGDASPAGVPSGIGAILKQLEQPKPTALAPAQTGAAPQAGAAPSQVATTPQASPADAQVNADKLAGVGNHPLGPDDDLLPPDEKGKSVADLKDLKTPDGKQKYALMANLGNQEGMKDKLKQVVGDVDNDPKAFARGEAYLQKIKHMPNPDGSKRPDDMVNNGKLEGCTSSGDIRSGTEAAILKDSFKGGPQVADKDAPNPIDKSKAYGWLNDQKALAPTNDKHVVNGGNGRSDAQVFFMNVGENIKKGFEKIGEGFKKIGEGIKNFAEGAVHAIGGAFKVLGGVLSFNGDLIKKGANDVKDGGSEAWHSVDTTIKGAGEVLGGAASAAVAVSPAGMAINQLTGNAASRLADGVFEGAADTLVKGRNGLVNAADAAVHGDWKGVGKGLYDTANLALMLVPGAGEANAARVVAQNAAKGLIKAGAKDAVKDEAKDQYDQYQDDASQTA